MTPFPPAPDSGEPEHPLSTAIQPAAADGGLLTEPNPDEELVTVASFQLANEAELAKLHLEEAGIHSFLADVETVNWDWFLGQAIGYIKVQVLQSQAEAA